MLTPVDIETREFKKTRFNGYSTEEVDEFLEEIVEDMEKLYKENSSLKEKVSSLSEAVGYYKSMEETIKNSIVAAEKNAEDTKKLAENEADQIIKKAEIHAEELLQNTRLEESNLRNRIMQLQSRYIGLKDGLKAVLETQIKMLEANEDMLNNGANDK